MNRGSEMKYGWDECYEYSREYDDFDIAELAS